MNAAPDLAARDHLRIGLVSDTHFPEAGALWPQVFAAFQDVDVILHGGDVHDLALIDELEAIAPTFVARGNGEDGSGGRPVQPEHALVRPSWLLSLGGLCVGLTHDIPVPPEPPHDTIERGLQRAFGSIVPDVVVYGDTHVEHVEQYGPTLLVNPGSPTFPHNLQRQLGTIGFLEIHDGVPTAEICQITESGIAPFDWTRWRRPLR